MTDKPTGVWRVYLDQSAYGNMIDDGKGDWRQSDLGKLLADAQAAGTAVVWAGPTNVIEAIQASDPTRRKALALTMLDLIDVKRMWWGHEFEAINDFFTFVTQFAPKGIRHREFFAHHGDTARQVWLGALGLAAATDAKSLGEVVEDLRRTKAINQLIHARFALDPGEWVDSMVDASANLKTTTADPLADLAGKSLAEIDALIRELAVKAQKMDRSDATKLEKNRKMIAEAYGGIEIGSLLRATFRLPMEVDLTFDIPHIVENWPSIQKATGCPSLPEDVRKAQSHELLNTPLGYTVLEHLIRAVAKKGLMTTYIGNQVILREMQRCINDKVLPTSGLTFDADHAAALVRFEVFFTTDEWLAASAKTLAKSIEKYTDGKWTPEIATNVKQLRGILDKKK